MTERPIVEGHPGGPVTQLDRTLTEWVDKDTRPCYARLDEKDNSIWLGQYRPCCQMRLSRTQAGEIARVLGRFAYSNVVKRSEAECERLVVLMASRIKALGQHLGDVSEEIQTSVSNCGLRYQEEMLTEMREILGLPRLEEF